MTRNKQPNVLLVFCDQLRHDTIRHLGNPLIRTPNLDRLARQATAFTSTYTPNPVSVPARASLIFGQYPWTTGCYENNYAMPQDGRPTFMQSLTDAGYRTHGIGKCHFMPDRQALRGFQTRETQEEIVNRIEDDDYMQFLHANGGAHITDPHGVRGEMYYLPQPAQMPAALHPTQWVGDRSVAFINDPARCDQPWFLFSSIVHPHPPFAPPAPWHKLYRGPLMPLPKLPPDYESLWTHINRSQNRYKYRDQGLDLNLLRQMRAYYYACVSFIDYQLGRLLDALEATQQLDRTLIIFTSDHGEHLGDYGCFGKRSYHDSCSRIPLLVRWPGADGATERRCERPASLVDIGQTILTAAGVQADTFRTDGVDLAELATGAIGREAVFIQYERGARGIFSRVTERHKFTYSAGDQREYFFDRLTDPAETRNLDGVGFARAQQDAARSALMETLRSADEADVVDGTHWQTREPVRMPANPDAGLMMRDHPWARQDIAGYDY